MGIFQKSVIQKHLSNLDKELVEKAFQKFRENYNPSKIEKIKELKEEEYQDGFLRDLFVDVFGYTLKPNENYNLAREFKNQGDGKKADGAILNPDSKAGEKAVAVIELKSTKTKDLKSITEQAFNYKNNQPDCKYVITSNFQKLRFYIDYANEFEEFNLFHLQKTDFDLLFLILNSNSIFSDLPLKLKEETKFHEQDISDKLYKDYSVFKNRLFENLIKNNPGIDKLTLFNKSQKLLDRFLFILFAEDSGLLPPNSISRIIDTYHKLEELYQEKPIYDLYKQYFGFLNTGRKGKTTAGDIPAYNGGLFYTDELLDNLKIDDGILIDDLLKLSEYDFNTEVDVNILGHIFEHSLSEIEEITAEIEGTATDKTKSKRKKDGVYYTPKYITQYIVENTIGTLCNEKRTELDIEEIEFDGTYRIKDGNLSIKGTKLFQKLNDYKDWLLSLKIVDPACGSGAFLNQALNFLILEHKNIDDIIAELTNTALRLFDTEKSILENNLFGVDINEESVEIAKLSLWLRTAHKDRKLSNLNNNIKCGNSLIDDPEIAGDKAFDWNVEFKEIMQNGGFDVVIGNPPYVFGGNEGISKIAKIYFKNNYKTGSGKVNLFTLFIEKSYNILSNLGEFSFIIPNTFLRVTSYHVSRKFFIDNFKFRELADLGNDVFQGAVTTSIILIAKKTDSNSNDSIRIIKDFKGSSFELGISDVITNNYIITSNLSKEKLNLIRKLKSNSLLLGNECEEMIFGVVITKNKDEVVFNKYNKGLKPFLEGKDIGAYYIRPIHSYLNYNPNLLHRARTKKVFEVAEKILVQRITGGVKPLKAAYDNNQYYDKESINNIILKPNSRFSSKTVLALLNSSLINWFYNNQFTNKSTLTVNISKEYLSRIPVRIPAKQEAFNESVDLMMSLTGKLFNITTNLTQLLQSKFTIEKFSKRLQNWYDLEFGEFLNELFDKKIKLSLSEESEWMTFFSEQKTEAESVKTEIERTYKEIDQMVYELYGLTEEEIRIVENN